MSKNTQFPLITYSNPGGFQNQTTSMKNSMSPILTIFIGIFMIWLISISSFIAYKVFYVSDNETFTPDYMTKEEFANSYSNLSQGILESFSSLEGEITTSLNNISKNYQIQATQINNISSDVSKVISDLNSLKGRITQLEEKPIVNNSTDPNLSGLIDNFNSNILTLTNSIKSIQSTLKNQQGQIKSLSDQINIINNKEQYITPQPKPIASNTQPNPNSPIKRTAQIPNQEPVIMIDEDSGSINIQGLSPEQINELLKRTSIQPQETRASSNLPNANSLFK